MKDTELRAMMRQVAPNPQTRAIEEAWANTCALDERLRKVEALVFGRLTTTSGKLTVEYVERQGKEAPPSEPARATPAVAAETASSPVAGSSPASPAPRAFRVGDMVRCACYGNGLEAKDTDGLLTSYDPPFATFRSDDGKERHCRSDGLALLSPAPSPPPAAEEPVARLKTVEELAIELSAALRDLEACRKGRETFQLERDEARADALLWKKHNETLAARLAEIRRAVDAD